MAEGNTYNNYDNRVSTVGLTLFDEQGMMLRCSYLGDTLNITLAEPMKTDAGKNSYPDKARHSILLTTDRVATLYQEIISKELVEAMNKGEDFREGVFLNKRKESILQIRYENNELYLVLCTDIDEKRISKNSYVFHFNKTDVIYDYDPTGTFTSQGTKNGMFFVFTEYLRAGLEALTGAGGHAVRKVDSWTRTQIFNYLKGMSAKLGVTLESPTYNRRTSGFQKNEVASAAGTDADMNFTDAGLPEEDLMITTDDSGAPTLADMLE